MEKQKDKSFTINPFASDVYSLGIIILDLMGIINTRALVSPLSNSPITPQKFQKAIPFTKLSKKIEKLTPTDISYITSEYNYNTTLKYFKESLNSTYS